MCGIVGLYRPEGVTDADGAMVQGATEALRHRGPDGEGYWKGRRIALGHARLSIIDLATGHQPLFNEDGQIAVVLNGEIYNYQSLTAELRARGHQFRTSSDTEVLVHGYEEWGDTLVDHLDGMFAFAIWDGRKDRLLLARDRFGEKPLYHTSIPGQPGTIWFASEIKALLTSPLVPRRLASDHLDEYLMYRHVIAPGTMFEGIRQLPPGHLMVVEIAGCTERRYHEERLDTPPSTEAGGRLEELLSGAVHRRLMSDVNLGTVLSGGVDSSIVSAIAARERPGMATFCVGFEDPRYDERRFARQVAESIGSTHHELVLGASDITSEFHRLTWANDEPLTHPNSIAMHLIFRYAKSEQGVTVLLSGEGADEVFGGYDWYRAMLRRERLLRWPGVDLVAPLVPGARGAVLRRLADPEYPLLANGFAQPETLAALLGRAFEIPASRREAWPNGLSPIDGLFRYDQATYLPALLQRQDRMSMAAGVEARVVFLCHFLVAWANRLPTRQKVSSRGRKLPLRSLVRQLLPAFVLERPKVGFTLPLADWMRAHGELRDRVESLRSGNALVSGWCDRAGVQNVLDKHQQGANHSDLLWTLVALEEWGQTFLAGPNTPLELPGATSSLVRQTSRPGLTE